MSWLFLMRRPMLDNLMRIVHKRRLEKNPFWFCSSCLSSVHRVLVFFFVFWFFSSCLSSAHDVLVLFFVFWFCSSCLGSVLLTVRSFCSSCLEPKMFSRKKKKSLLDLDCPRSWQLFVFQIPPFPQTKIIALEGGSKRSSVHKSILLRYIMMWCHGTGQRISEKRACQPMLRGYRRRW